jgi:hemerythrin
MATLLAWRDAYNVEVREIDEQHRRLFELVNLLYSGIVFERRIASVEAVLDELVDYARMHFALEESLLRPFHDSGCGEHKAIHDNIVARVLAYQVQFKKGDYKVGMDLLFFLQEWLMEHINTVVKECKWRLSRGGGKKVWVKEFL